jgi:hypothetical protein
LGFVTLKFRNGGRNLAHEGVGGGRAELRFVHLHQTRLLNDHSLIFIIVIVDIVHDLIIASGRTRYRLPARHAALPASNRSKVVGRHVIAVIVRHLAWRAFHLFSELAQLLTWLDHLESLALESGLCPGSLELNLQSVHQALAIHNALHLRWIRRS